MKHSFKVFLLLAFFLHASEALLGQSMSPFTCAIISKRNNGNGSASSGAGVFVNEPSYVPANYVATPANVRGGIVNGITYAATTYNNVSYKYANKTGNMTINWVSNTFAGMPLPIISRVWLTTSGPTSLTAVKFGPPKAAYLSGGKWYTDYHYYFQNFPPQGKITVEWVDPQNNAVIQYNTYDLQTGLCETNPVTFNCTPTIITQPSNQTLCGNGTTATFSVEASGAATTSSYQWQFRTSPTGSWSSVSNGSGYSGATTSTLSISTPTAYNGYQYRVVVTGGTGCGTVTSTEATLTARPSPTAAFATTTYCGISNRNLEVTLTGSAPWSITYTTNGASPTTITDITSSPYYLEVTPVATTTYALTNVSDAYCSATPTGNVSASVGVVPSIAATNAFACFGSSTFSLTYSNATGSPTTYSISTGIRAMSGFTAVSDVALSASPLSITIPSNAPAGTYDFNLTVKNAAGCTSAVVPFTVTIRSLPTVGAYAGNTSSICAGATANLTAAPAGLGAYAWTVGGGSVLATDQTYSPVVNATTTYTVTGTDANGCSNTANVTVTTLSGSAVTVTPSSATICAGNAVVLEASGAESYSWTPATNLSSTVGDAVIASPTTTTTYTVTGTNSSGCTSSTTVTVTVNTVNITATANGTVCSGSVRTLTASGGSTYTWYPTTGLFTDAAATVAYTGTSAATVYAKPSSNTTYYVVGTSAANCSSTTSTTVTLASAPVVSGSSTGNTLIFCTQGTSTFNLSVATNAALSSTTWSYSTNGTSYTNLTAGVLTSVTGTNLQTSTSGSSPNVTYTTTLSGYGNSGYTGPRYFQLAMTDASCTYNYNIFITDTKGTNPTPTATQSTICSGSSTVLTIGSLASGSTVLWQTSPNNSTWTDSTGATSASITVSPTGNRYYRAVFNGGSGNCGSTSSSILITVVSSLAANTVTPSTTCTTGSGSYTLTGSAITSGTYQWQSSTTSSSDGFSDVLGVTSQSYTLPVNIVPQTTWYRRTATNGTCPSNTSASVAVYAPISKNSITNATTAFCQTATVTGLTVTTPVGGSDTYSYQWQSSTNGIDFTNIGSATNPTYTTLTQTQNYWYRRVVTSGGCSDNSNSFKITVNPLPTIGVTSGSTVCASTPVTLTATGGNSYSWSPSNDLSATSGSTVVSTPTTTRTYTVTGTDVNGCTNTASTTLTATALPATPTLSSSSISRCSNGSAIDLTSYVTSGGTTEWYTAPEANASYLVASPSAVSTAGTYYCFAKSGTCYSTSSASLTITVVDMSTPIVSGTAFTDCSPATFDLTEVEPEPPTDVTLQWHTVASNPNAGTLLSNPTTVGTSGTYYLYAYSSALGCYSTSPDQVTVTINTTPATPSLTTSSETVCSPTTVDLTNNYTAVDGITYTWYKDTEAAEFAVLAPSTVSQSGTYLLVASSNGCTSAPASISVTVNAKPSITLSAADDFCDTYSGSIAATVTDASTPTYAWYFSTNNGGTWTQITAGNAGTTYTNYTTPTLGVSSLTPAAAGTYFQCIVTNSTGCNTTSDAAIVLTQPNPTVTCPGNTTYTVGNDKSLSVTTTGTFSSIQWQVSTNGTDFNNLTESSPYSGTTESTLLITGAPDSVNGRYYRAVLTNQCGSYNCSSTTRLTIATPLPVSWLSFTGKAVNKQVVLDWSTASETNSRDFRVMHSTDGTRWTEIGSVEAAGNSQNIRNYQYTHTTPADGNNTYQLQQRDLDGRTQRSRVVNVVIGKGQPGLIVYPNPVEDSRIRVQLASAATIILYNSIGAEVFRQSLPMGTHNIDLPQLASGIYRVRAGNETLPLLIN